MCRPRCVRERESVGYCKLHTYEGPWRALSVSCKTTTATQLFPSCHSVTMEPVGLCYTFFVTPARSPIDTYSVTHRPGYLLRLKTGRHKDRCLLPTVTTLDR